MVYHNKSIKLEKKKLGEEVFKTLRDRVVYLEYAPETVLSEKALCEEFGVSRSPLREAILRLEELGLVKSIPRYGTYVTHIDINEIRCVYELRKTLEALAGSLAAQRITQDQVEELQKIVVAYQENLETKGTREMMRADMSFHETVYEATRNPILDKTLKSLNSRCLRFFNAMESDFMFTAEACEQLRRICKAISDGNQDLAARFCEDHVQHFLDRIKTKLL
jgi:GntR family transcriptional regulator, rspAB operon transcriptional repressor